MTLDTQETEIRIKTSETESMIANLGQTIEIETTGRTTKATGKTSMGPQRTVIETTGLGGVVIIRIDTEITETKDIHRTKK